MTIGQFRRLAVLSATGAVMALAQAVSAQAGGIDYGPFCGADCQKSLTLKADPASIKGKVGMAVASLTFPYGVALKGRTEAAAKAYFPGIELSVGDGQNDPTAQTALVDNFIAQGVKVLIINAVESMKVNSGVLKIKTECTQSICRIIIEDNGCGMSVEQQNRLFEPYFTGKTKGMGLGMITTMNIIQSHGGDILFTSEVDKGTRFALAFPVLRLK